MKTEHTAIEWADYTFNPWRGCTKVSEGCAHCYAETLSHRNPGVLGQWGKGKPRVLASDAMWHSPPAWNDLAGGAAHEDSWSHDDGPTPLARPRVFCASLADWLDEEVPVAWLRRLLALIRDTPNLDWLLLTKRPQNWHSRLTEVYEAESTIKEWAMVRAWLGGRPPPNVWLGVSVENQARADERIPLFVKIPAKVRFLSCEPLLGPIELHSPHIKVETWNVGESFDGPAPLSGIHWVIAGGESGPQARSMHPDWVRSLRDQCAAAAVPFLFKQWGEWVYPQQMPEPMYFKDLPKAPRGQVWTHTSATSRHGYDLLRVGKKKAGRLLDGREHNEFPSLRP